MGSDSDSDVDITINNKMTPAKLKFIKSSSIRNLLSRSEKRAAEKEVEADQKDLKEKPSSSIKKRKQKKTVDRKQVDDNTKIEKLTKKLRSKNKLAKEISTESTDTKETVEQIHDKSGRKEKQTKKVKFNFVEQQPKKKIVRSEKNIEMKNELEEESDSEENDEKPTENKEKDNSKESQEETTEGLNRKKTKKRIAPHGDDEEGICGTIYLGHVPHGFYENEIRSYFKQFGRVRNVKLSRAKKTGRSKGYAFVQFYDKHVASVAAEAMDGYLMHGKRLKAHVVADEKVSPYLFKRASRPIVRNIKRSVIERNAMIGRSKDPEKVAERSKNIKKCLRRKRKRLSELQINYTFPEIQNEPSASTD